MPPWACLTRPSCGLSAPVNAPFSWPKSTLSTRVSGKGRAVDDYEVVLGPSAVVVYRPCEDLLSGACFARNQYVDFAVSCLGEEVQTCMHPRAAA